MHVVSGTTDLAIRGTAFATPGVAEFMENTMKIDNQGFLGKMEGHAVQGIKGMFPSFSYLVHSHLFLGAAKNHSQRIITMRAELRTLITDQLC